MNGKAATPFEFTGRHMLLIMLAFFGVVVSVNVTMAVLANTSWTGLIVPNSYVASQHFDTDTAEREAMLAKGYALSLATTKTGLTVELKDKAGIPMPLREGKLLLTHIGAGARQLEFALRCNASRCEAATPAVSGLWKGDVLLSLADGSTWRQAVEIAIGGG